MHRSFISFGKKETTTISSLLTIALSSISNNSTLEKFSHRFSDSKTNKIHESIDVTNSVSIQFKWEKNIKSNQRKFIFVVCSSIFVSVYNLDSIFVCIHLLCVLNVIYHLLLILFFSQLIIQNLISKDTQYFSN